MREFQFKKSYEMVKIAGKEYKIDMSDEKTKEYNKAFNRFYQKAKGISEKNIEKLTAFEQEKILEEQKQNVKDALELVLGEGSYDELYAAAGKSTTNLMEVLLFISETFQEKSTSLKEETRKMYTGKK